MKFDYTEPCMDSIFVRWLKDAIDKSIMHITPNLYIFEHCSPILSVVNLIANQNRPLADNN